MTTVGLDRRDYDVIVELQRDARQSYRLIGRKLGFSEASVRRRVASLTKKGVIRITAVTTPWKLGYTTPALIGIQADLSKLDSVLHRLSEIPRVSFVSHTGGRFDIIVWVNSRSSDELAEFLKGDLARIQGIFRSETLVILEVRKRATLVLKGDLLTAKSDSGATVLPRVEETSQEGEAASIIDSRDYDILAELQSDARQSSAVLARKLKTSEATVRRRLKHLMDGEYVNVVASVNPAKVGHPTHAIIGIAADISRLDGIANQLVSVPNIHLVIMVAGQFDILIWCAFTSQRDLAEFVKRNLASIPGIIRSETFINLQVLKSEPGLLLPRPDNHDRPGIPRRARGRRESTARTARSPGTRKMSRTGAAKRGAKRR